MYSLFIDTLSPIIRKPANLSQEYAEGLVVVLALTTIPGIPECRSQVESSYSQPSRKFLI